jgi:acyl-coenzyme A synthetase/AMP-(fatty) acid ligase
MEVFDGPESLMTMPFSLAPNDLLCSSSELTDGVTTLTLRDAKPIFTRLEDALVDAQVHRNDCVALTTSNDVASAMLLLFLLARGQGLLLLAPRTTRYLADQELPAYCTHLVSSTEPGRVNITLGCAPRTNRQCSNRVFLPTSGSTATPKVVVHDCVKLLTNARNCMERFQLSGEDRVCIPVPLFHMYGLGAAFLPALLAGASVDLQAGANALRFVERERAFDPTVAFLTPAFCHSLLRVRKAHRHYRLTVAAGDRTSAQTFRAYEERHNCLVSLYGSTELGAIAAGSPSDSLQQRMLSTGRLMSGVELADGGTCAVQNAGRFDIELRFRHSSACLGYADKTGDPDPSDLVENAVYATQDLGMLDAEGYLHISGRIDHTVNRDGMLVAFSMVEQALSEFDEFEEVVVVSPGRTPRGGQLTAVCIAGRAAAPELSRARRLVATRLPAYAIPDKFVWVAELPRLASGKPDRRAVHDSLAGLAVSPEKSTQN